jgi:hypothetical protein
MFFIIIFTYLKWIWHLRHGSSLLTTPWQFATVYLLQVIKNDDEKRCFLKWFGFSIQLFKLVFRQSNGLNIDIKIGTSLTCILLQPLVFDETGLILLIWDFFTPSPPTGRGFFAISLPDSCVFFVFQNSHRFYLLGRTEAGVLLKLKKVIDSLSSSNKKLSSQPRALF